MSTQLLTELPSIQYTGMDFESVMTELQAIVRNNPRWAENWSEFYSSEAGTMLLQLMSWICDNLSIRQDVLLNESFLATANKKRNKIKLLKTIGYQPKLSHSAQAALTVELTSVSEEDIILTPEFSSSTESLALRTNNISKVSGYDVNNNTINWEILSLVDGKPDYLAGVKLKAGSSLYTKDIDDNTIFAIEGETLYKEFASATSDGPYIDLYDSNIAADSIVVYEKAFAKKCQQVTSFITSEAMDKSGSIGIPYVVSLNEDESIRISFAKKDVLPQERLLPAGTEVSIFYRTTSGSVGNIPPTFINTRTVFTTTTGENIDAIVYNEATAYNGTDNEEIDTAVLNAPLTLRTFDRAVTVEDYDVILNNYPGLLKAKTYTASNNPNTFYTSYGRYINPQEAFIFALGNRDYSKVPSAQYNNYPWLSLFKTPRLNEIYTFDNGANNVNTLYSNIYYNFRIEQDEQGGRKTYNFNNATILNIGSEFNEGIKGDLTNPNFQLKIATEPVEASYFSDIPYSLMEKNNNVLVTDLGENKEVVVNDNARFITQQSYDKELDDFTVKPIDIINSRYIIVSLDERAEIVIDLFENVGTGEGKGMPGEHYYIFFDFNPTGSVVPASDATILGAAGRHGIVQLINQQIEAIANPETTGETADEYTENHGYQWFGLKLTSKDSLLDGIAFDLSSDYKRKDLILTINGKTFKFPFSPDVIGGEEQPTKKCSTFVDELNTNIQSVDNEGYYNFIRVYDEDSSWVKFNAEDYDFSKIKFCIGQKVDYSEGYSYFFDIFLKASDEWLNGEKVVVSYVDVEAYNSESDVYNGVTFDYSKGVSSFIHAIHNADISTEYTTLLGKNFEACSYEGLASFLDDPNDNTKGYLKIQSPLTGENSSIRFVTNSDIEIDQATERDYGNFIKNFLEVPFYGINPETGTGLGFSQVAHGQKKIFIVSGNANNPSYRDDINATEGTALEGSLDVGNLIFENSCIYNNYDFSSLYAFYKFESNNTIELGSVYNNFYYTGDPEIDENVKDKLKYITGTVVKNGKVDNISSNYEVKLTETPQNINSFYAIKNDLDVVRSDKVEIISNNISNTISSPANLKFTFDDILPDYKISVSLTGLENGPDVANAIKTAITTNEYYDEDMNNIYANYISVINDVVKTSYECKHQVCMSGLSRENGNITFYHDDSTGVTPEGVKNLYKAFLGTNKTNPDFYRLYPKEAFEGNVENIAADEYFYYPTSEQNLVFTYREIINGKSRPADYYITYDNNNKQYLLVKTTDSQFPSSNFYVHFINDRSSEDLEIDEKALNTYMNDKKISGMDLYFATPYFKGYDVKATIYYNANYSEASVRSFVEENVKKLCSIENAEIGGYMSQARIIKEIMNIDGVENVIINYFGYDYTKANSDGFKSTAQIDGEFYEILFLNDYEEGKHGMMFEYEIQQ